MKFKITTPYGTAEHRTSNLSINETSVIRRLMVPRGLRDAAFEPLEREIPLQRFNKINPHTLCPHGHGVVSVSVSTKETDGDPALAAEVLALMSPLAEGSSSQQDTSMPSVLFKSHTMKGYCDYCRKPHEKTEYSITVRVTREGFPIQRVYSYNPDHNCDSNIKEFEE